METRSENVRRRVAAGMQFLEDRLPGCTWDIDTDTVDVDDPLRCPLAQTVGVLIPYRADNPGAYGRARQLLGLTPQQCADLGLFVSDGWSQLPQDLDAPVPWQHQGHALTEEWKRQLTALREPALV